ALPISGGRTQAPRQGTRGLREQADAGVAPEQARLERRPVRGSDQGTARPRAEARRDPGPLPVPARYLRQALGGRRPGLVGLRSADLRSALNANLVLSRSATMFDPHLMAGQRILVTG